MYNHQVITYEVYNHEKTPENEGIFDGLSSPLLSPITGNLNTLINYCMIISSRS